MIAEKTRSCLQKRNILFPFNDYSISNWYYDMQEPLYSTGPITHDDNYNNNMQMVPKALKLDSSFVLPV